MIVVPVMPVSVVIVVIAAPVMPVSVVIIVIAAPLVHALDVLEALDMLAAVARHVLPVVPIVFYEVDRPATSMVLRAMPAPVFLMPGRYVQINGLHDNMLSRLHRDDRLCIDDRRRRNIADVDLAVEAGLADADRHPDVAGKCRSRKETQHCPVH